jgi:Glycosyltransferase
MDRVHFLGPVFGAEKRAAFAAANAFILPSVSEGLPMVVLEAWSHGLPVVMTRACNLPEGFAAEAALEIGTESEEIRAGLDLLARMSEEQRRAMGHNGFRLCRDRFSQARNSELMRMVYRWLLKRGPRPDCVLAGIDEPVPASADPPWHMPEYSGQWRIECASISIPRKVSSVAGRLGSRRSGSWSSRC